tara:strand:+ start:606 stop:1742 length:1137 start_codon:yes stop_codon:yes gene_type:complete
MAAVATTVVFRYLRIPVILGYIVVGVLLGPHAVGLIADGQNIRDIAEFGVVFLLFTIGLELSFKRLTTLKNVLISYGGLQISATVIITQVIGIWLGLTLIEAMIVGFVVAMSSTAIVTKQLVDQDELHTPHGTNALAILLLQDLAVVPCLILIPSLGQAALSSTIMLSVLFALAKGVIAIAFILLLGKRLLRPLFHHIAAAQSSEIFTLATLLVALSFAWVTDYMGLSLALGAFLAGITLAETEFRHQISAEVRPFRDVLLGLFFITIGIQFDLQALSITWQWILILVVALVIGKTLLISALGIILKNGLITSTRTGLVLAQGGEFGFVILILALDYELIPQDYGQVILSSLLVSMMLSPVFIRFNANIANILKKKPS